jgi:mono/diheme cytochrome c family protein
MRAKRFALALVVVTLVAIPSCQPNSVPSEPNSLRNAYAVEPDWNNPDHLIPLNYQQAQGKRVFDTYCVWCHADSTPAGPSNRFNLTPTPSLANDGKILNPLSDDYLSNIIGLGGSAMGKSAMMPPWGRTLSEDDIQDVIAFLRAIAVPPYQPPAQPAPKYSVR